MTNELTQPVRQFYERLAQSDLTGALTLLTDNAELVQADSLPYGGRYVGASGMQEFFRRFLACWQAFRSEDIRYFVGEEQVVVTSVAQGLTRQGHSITMPMAQVYTLRHGKISHVRPFYFDTARLLF